MTTPVYVIINTVLSDPAAYEPYKAAVAPMIIQHGGEYLVRGGPLEVVEGNWSPTRIVMLRFPSREAAHGFLNDPNYAPYKALRQSVAHTDMVIVDAMT